MRLATRVEAAMAMGKGIWKVVEVMVMRMDCVARYSEPNWPVARVRISKANHSASTMIIPGMDRRIIGPG